MGLFDLLAPILGAVDQILETFVPGGLRLVGWGILSGWFTMLLYRRFSRQEAIAELKAAQKQLQDKISRFEGEFNELMPMIRKAFSLGFRQLGLSIGPAILATIPILFIVAWVATRFVYEAPPAGDEIAVTVEPAAGELSWSPSWSGWADAAPEDSGWTIQWPPQGESVTLSDGDAPVLSLSDDALHGVIHKKRWWNALFGNPAGYLPEDSAADLVRIELPEREYLPFGPGWMRGWMFAFFGTFLLASIAFKFVLKID